jgi:energy-coupling factor transporter ATP-binding protein EcfA2
VIGLDGRSGSGKTTLAATLARLVPEAQVVAMDEIYPGWDGLAAGVRLLVEQVLEPLARGIPAQVPRWDWRAGRPAAPRPLPPARFVLVEGVGSGALAGEPYRAGLVWLEAPAGVRRRRALTRDGDSYAPHWDRWSAQEESYLRADDPRSRADVVLDTTSRMPDGNSRMPDGAGIPDADRPGATLDPCACPSLVSPPRRWRSRPSGCPPP